MIQDRAAYQRAWRRRNLASVKRSAATWKAKNPTYHKKYAAERYQRTRKQQIAKARAWRLANLERHRETQRRAYLRRKYNMTTAEFQALLEEQKNACAICERPFDGTRVCVDHNHSSQQVRGLLCDNCNHGVGKFHENPALLTRAIQYLENHATSR